MVTQRQLRESQARYRDVLARMGEAFFVTDKGFRVLEVNDEAQRLDQRRREEIVGRLLWELHPGSERSR